MAAEREEGGEGLRAEEEEKLRGEQGNEGDNDCTVLMPDGGE